MFSKENKHKNLPVEVLDQLKEKKYRLGIWVEKKEAIIQEELYGKRLPVRLREKGMTPGCDGRIVPPLPESCQSGAQCTILGWTLGCLSLVKIECERRM